MILLEGVFSLFVAVDADCLVFADVFDPAGCLG